MRVLYEFCRKGDGKANEDIYGTCCNYAWVVDGATDVFQKCIIREQDEVNWYVQQLNDELVKQCSIDNLGNNMIVIQKAVNALYDRICKDNDMADVADYWLPTFAIAFIAIRDNVLSYYILGDCSISYIHNGCLHSLKDGRIKKFSLANRDKLKKFYQTANDEEAPLSIYRDTRMKANADNGYPIGMITGKGIDRGITGEVEISKGDKILVFSDGFIDYLEHDQDAIFRLFDLNSVKSEIEKMYTYLEDEKSFRDSPRPKKIDDSTLLLLEVEE